MYACICNKITEQELEESLIDANGNINEALRKLGLGNHCGICLVDAVEKVGMQIPAKDSKIAKKGN